MADLVVDLSDARPIFALPESSVAAIREAAPDWDVVVVDAAADGAGDGSARVAESALRAVAAGAQVYMGFGIPEAVLREGPGLRWVHSGAAGVRGSLTPAMVESEVVFTNSAGIHGPPVAESVIGALLHFGRGFDMAIRAQREGRWDKTPFDAADAPIRELSRSTVGVVGLGGLGREVAWRAAALGARVLGTRRRPEPVDVPGVEVLVGPDGLDRLLGASDYVVLTVPETPETTGMIDGRALARMKPGAVLVNVARGGLVDTAALIEALERGELRGAMLDTFPREPLAADDPLWRTPRILITPHITAYTHAFWERETGLIVDNIGRYRAGNPLRNVVDKGAGY